MHFTTCRGPVLHILDLLYKKGKNNQLLQNHDLVVCVCGMLQHGDYDILYWCPPILLGFYSVQYTLYSTLRSKLNNENTT